MLHCEGYEIKAKITALEMKEHSQICAGTGGALNKENKGVQTYSIIKGTAQYSRGCLYQWTKELNAVSNSSVLLGWVKVCGALTQ